MDLYHLLLHMTVINIVIYLVLLILFVYFRDGLIRFHLRILRLADKHKGDLEKMLLLWMGRYKLLILFFNIVPLLAIHLHFMK